jgi:hypothetical protein
MPSRRSTETRRWLKLNGTHQLLAYADGDNLLGGNIETIKRRTETLMDASKEVTLEVNVGKTKYMLVYHRQYGGQNRGIKIEKLFENMGQLKYVGTTKTSQH